MIMDIAIQNKIKKAGVIAVLVVDELNHIRPTIESLLAGGVQAIELTLRTPIALEAISYINQEYPEILLGVGTILTPKQIHQVKEAGADFGVAPGMNRRVIDASIAAELPFAPGIATPSDIESALEYECKILKFFPAEPSGGLSYLKSINAPYSHLGLSYIPLGGINEANLSLYAREAFICGVGGSWIAPKSLILEEQWETITARAKNAVAVFTQEKQNG